jgi:hypothetical protein
LLTGLSILTAFVWASMPVSVKTPERLAIYYGFPSLVNGSNGDIAKASQVFSSFDAVVFGDGLEFADVNPSRKPPGPGADEHGKTRDLISLLNRSQRATRVYGYVTLGSSQSLPIEEIHRRAALWAEMGVKGIFLDEAGYDFGVTRSRQNAAVEAVHSLALAVFMNAFRPEDLFSPEAVGPNTAGGGNPEGKPGVLGSKDLFLLESFQLREGQYETLASWHSRTSRAVAYRDRYRSRVFAVTTARRNQPFSRDQFFYAWWSAVLWGLDGIGWGQPSFSSEDNFLPLPDTPTVDARTRYSSAVLCQGNICSRHTDRGTIVIDTAQHSAAFTPSSPVAPRPAR